MFQMPFATCSGRGLFGKETKPNQMEQFIGIDVGGTNVKVGLVDEKGNLLDKKKYPTAELRAQPSVPDAFRAVLKETFERYPQVKQTGIAVPGTLDKARHTLLELPNLPELNDFNLHAFLSETFPRQAFYLENDANAAALGELYFGQEVLPDDFIFLTLGTGVGGACILNRKIFTGGGGNAMEPGHMIAGNGRTVEQNIGKKGILGMALTALEGYHGYSVLSDLGNLEPKSVVKAAKGNDHLALDVFYEVGVYLGQCIVSLVRVLDVKTVLIGGGVSETFEYVKEGMSEQFRRYLSPYYLDAMDIRLATLGNNAGIVGAAALCFEHIQTVG